MVQTGGATRRWLLHSPAIAFSVRPTDASGCAVSRGGSGRLCDELLIGHAERIIVSACRRTPASGRGNRAQAFLF